MGEAGSSTSEALLPEGMLWTECGRFDEEGHALGARLAEQVHAGLRDVADRVLQLARAGRAFASLPTMDGCCFPADCRRRRSHGVGDAPGQA